MKKLFILALLFAVPAHAEEDVTTGEKMFLIANCVASLEIVVVMMEGRNKPSMAKVFTELQVPIKAEWTALFPDIDPNRFYQGQLDVIVTELKQATDDGKFDEVWAKRVRWAEYCAKQYGAGQ